jgi:uncharacterized protein (DUF58 family)
MIPTRRLLLVLLLGALPMAGATLQPWLIWVALVYFLVVLVLVAADVVMTPRPDQVEVERLNDSRLSLGT